MSFYWPDLLWLLIAPATLLAWGLAGRSAVARALHPKILHAEADARHLSLVSSPSKTATHARPWLCAGLALAIVALARPQWGRIEEPVFDQSREILLALDLSRSMNSPDVPPSRLARARLLIQSLLDRLRGERVGLEVFSGTAFLQCPLSADYEILHEFLPALNTSFMPEGGTNYRELLETALDAFSNADADRYLIILSDGEATDDDWRPLIGDLKKKNIRVIGLGVGTGSGAMIPDGAGGFVKDGRGAAVLSKLEDSTLRELAGKTGGVYADASSWVDLPVLLQATVDAGHRGQFHEENRVRFVDRFQWVLAPALLCLLISFWREFPVRPRPREVRLVSAAPPKASNLATIVCLIGIAGLCLASFSQADNEDIFAKPLSKMAHNLALSDHVVANDWARFAEATVDYGNRYAMLGKSIPPKTIKDGLDAVNNGEQMDAHAADWAQLRRELAALQKKTPEQTPPPQQQQQKQPQQNKSQQSQDKNSFQNNSNQNQQNFSSQNQSGSGQSQQNQRQEKSGQKNLQSASNPSPPSLGPSAFGSMKPPSSPPKPQVSDARELQKFGGTPRQNPAAADPALAVPLEKLDQLKQQDSPAVLYELMRGQAKPPADNGKNW